MRAVFFAALVFLFAHSAAPSHASGPSGLAYFMELALENNPRLRAAAREVKRVSQRYPQATSYDDPVLKYTEPMREIETRLGPQDRVFSLSQKVPFPGKLTLKGKIVRKEVEIARRRYEKVKRDLVAAVKKTYFELYFVDRALALKKENDAVLDYFARLSRLNYGLDVSELDELVRAQRSSARATFDLLKVEDMRKTVVARMNTLLNRPPDTPIPAVQEPSFVELPYGLEDLYKKASIYNDEVKLAGLEIERSELKKSLARYKYLPDFSIGVNYSQIGLPPAPVQDAGRDAVSVTFGVTIPLWFSRNRAAVKEKEILTEESTLGREAAASEAAGLVKKVYFDMKTSERIARMYKERFIPEAKESVDFAEARYKTGKESLARLLETQSMWIDFRLVYYRAFTEYLKDVAEIERLVAEEFFKKDKE